MLPNTIQGGMGVGVSSFRLARAVSVQGALGVYSGVAADVLLARTLQDGDPGDVIRDVLSDFPDQGMVRKIFQEYFVPGGADRKKPYKRVTAMTLTPSPLSFGLLVCATYAGVRLAKCGHSNPVGINILTKMEMHVLGSLAGAMLAGVGAVVMGAGIPREVPKVIDAFACGLPAEFQVAVTGTGSGFEIMRFDPRQVFGSKWPATLHRPLFLPIVSSALLAKLMVRKVAGVDGYVFEHHSAGGHNAPPLENRGRDEAGEPIYGERDEPDFEALNGLETRDGRKLPYWMAGGYGSPVKLREALRNGASGVQVGTLFAYCDESGLDPDFRRSAIGQALRGELRVKQDPDASPTGYPFQVVQRPGSLSEQEVFDQWYRDCSVQGLHKAHRMLSGQLEYRCPAGPIQAYLRKEGRIEDTKHSRCLCRGLLRAIGRGDPGDAPIFTLGRDSSSLKHLAFPPDYSYTAAQVIKYLQGAA